MRGRPVDNPPESLRLFHLAELTQWNHLPVAGGLYDQHPRLLAEWEVIHQAKAKYEEQKQKREEEKARHSRAAAASKRKGR